MPAAPVVKQFFNLGAKLLNKYLVPKAFVIALHTYTLLSLFSYGTRIFHDFYLLIVAGLTFGADRCSNIHLSLRNLQP